jgi:hypothetical protein
VTPKPKKKDEGDVGVGDLVLECERLRKRIDALLLDLHAAVEARNELRSRIQHLDGPSRRGADADW